MAVTLLDAWGSIAAPLATLCAQLASSPHFQEWLSVAVEDWDDDGSSADKAESALERIFILEANTEQHAEKPYILVSPAPKISEGSLCAGTDSDGNTFGKFVIEFVRTIPAAYRSDNALAFIEFAGYSDDSGNHGVAAILDDLLDEVIDASFSMNPLIIESYETVLGPSPVQDEEDVRSVPYMGCIVEVPFGISR